MNGQNLINQFSECEKCKKCLNTKLKKEEKEKCKKCKEEHKHKIFVNENEKFHFLEMSKTSSILDISKKLKEKTFLKYTDIKEAIIYLGGRVLTLKEINKLPSVREKYKQTCLKRFGTENSLSKGSEIYKKRNKTVLEKYGVENDIQLDSVKQKIAEKKDKTVLEKYGVENVFQLDSVKQKIKNYYNNLTDEEKENKIIKQRETTLKTIKNNGSSLENGVRQILNELGKKYIYQPSGYHFNYKIENKTHWVLPDFLIEDKKIVIECQGDFWHANPKIYLADDYMFEGHTAKDIWKKDALKKQAMENRNYTVLYIWEDDFKNNIV